MSKDIRTFFTVNSKASGNKCHAKESVEKQKSGQRKRALKVIDSDSDEEPSLTDIKRSKSSVNEAKSKTSNLKNNSIATSKYFQPEPISASDIFGSKPIKRDKTRNIVKKTISKEIDEFHIDKDFESELLQLDDIGLDALTKDSSYNKNYNKKDKVGEEKIKQNSSGFIKVDDGNKQSACKKETNCEKTSEELEIPNPVIKRKHEQTSPENEVIIESKLLKVSPEEKINRSSRYKSPSKVSPSKKSPDKSSTLNSSLTSTVSLSKISPDKKLIARTNDRTNKIYGDSKKVFNESSTLNSKRNEENSKSPLKQVHKSPAKEPLLQEKKPSKQDKSPSSTSSEKQNTVGTSSNLWVDKYKPTSTKQIIGQQGDKSCVSKLITWLKNWERNQSSSKKLTKPSPWAKNDDGAFFKAALLSGPPGVGKTTTAHLVSKELGYDVVEFNASDTRSKKLLHQEVSELLSTNSLSPFFTGKGDHVTKKHVLLMDEVDGMAGNEDRGGVQELILLIKQSRVPIICMCNDRNHPKIRSLSNYCFDLRFSKPRAEQIRGAMMSLCFKEKLKITPDVLTDVIGSANQDIRLIINHLSMLSMEDSKLANSTKHIKMGPWDIVRKIFSEEEHKSMSIYDKCDLFFHDYNVTPLFVQENYLNAVPHRSETKKKIKKMESFALAARSMSIGDLTERSIRSRNAWGLLPVQAVFSSLVPGEILEGHIGAQINFPAWFGKNSRQTKMSRLLQELTVHSRLKISGNKEAMNLDYVVPLEKAIVQPLLNHGLNGITEALSVLSEYCLVREDLESLSELSSWPNTKNQFSEVESKVKAAFTRAYNKTSVPTPYAAVPIKKGSKVEVDNMDTNAEEDDVSQDFDEEEDEGLEADSMIVVKKKTAAKKVDKEVAPSTAKGGKNAKRGRKR